ncbi:ATP phosphoribosyltransferase [Flavilitoribacter nigricans]|uniref:ATP phosphoribosyltransferase n=1 Tax=Flavilitoribacter nigricans (strain ATCC 23147 / DSM 23189 / NBRC 102662 / NCIMB 1420 / SS-2) TaxID=1122177 RepID=A0A2D0N4K6_FLAN2|nr:ATP phosphoribosyltransferase [Flavilitoribacter nigricans]PHN03079.1 ATP phosphoribosyltransferase [Flavilitoribacter nigricans DSM 23189 = NBRC 102662]
MSTTRLKIAVQKSGRLLDDSLKLLKECGISIDNGKDQLKARARNFPVDILYLRNSDIPQYVQDGVADIGIIGQNTVVEKQKAIKEILPLGFSTCRLSIALPKDTEFSGPQDLNGKKIATSYPNSLRQYLDRHQISAEIHEISGSVEIAPNIGLADAICDLVSSGSTLFKNGLEEKDIILKSEAAIVAGEQLSTELQAILDKLLFRIKSVLAARSNKYLLMNAPNASVETIIKVLPGMKSPTVMPLAAEGWSSIHTVIAEDRFWDIIDQLKDAGAQGILVVPIEKMIL